MQRRIIQDIIPSARKSIRDIPIPHSRERAREIHIHKDDNAAENIREEIKHRHGGGNKSKKYFIIGGVVVVLVALYFAADAFAHATVSVTLGSESAPVDGSFTTRNISLASTTNGITDSVISITKTGSITLSATTTKDVETKATGTIIVFNDYSTTPQKLLANTRFETSGGLIYRIASSISVPGKTTKGGVTTPGSVTVTVTADQVGNKYNIDLSDFNIPGFAGEPEYDGIFARSKTQMTGGFSGTEPVIDGADRSSAEAVVRSNLQSEITAAASTSVPSGYVLYPNAYRVDFTSLPDTIDSNGNKVTINEQAELTGFALSAGDLSLALASDVVKGYAGEPITISNLGNLIFSTNAVPTATTSSMSFNLSGTAKFVWTVDAETFAAQLAGKPKSDFTTILQGYPHVSRASVSFFPFWLGSFPNDASEINIATSSAD